jgi:ribonuclease P protein component
VKTGRLKTKKDFEEVLRGAKKRQGELVSLFCLKTDAEVNRVGLIVARRNARTAVLRNYIKRVIYGFFRENCGRMGKGYSLIVRYDGTASGGPIKETGKRIREDLEKLARKEKVIT